jgi:hypothetical protein
MRPALVRVSLLCALVGVVPSAAQAQEAPKVLLSYDLKAQPTDVKIVSLRPNVTQSVFVQVQNPDTQVLPAVSVRLLPAGAAAGAAPLATADLGDIPAAATRAVTQWTFPPPAPPPAPPPPGQPPSPPPPPGVELAGPPFGLQVQVFAEKKPKPVAVKDLTLLVMDPGGYVEVKKIEYTADKEGKTNNLVVLLTARKDFTGPPCPVELDLRPDRIAGLRPGRTSGVYKQTLSRAGQTVQLSAGNLKFREAPPESGVVAITVDGYERAFLYETTFAAQGKTVTPVPVTAPQLRLAVPRYSPPAETLRVGVEVDNPPAAGGLVRVAFDRDRDGTFGRDETAEKRGDRQQRIRILPGGPDEGLLVRTEVKPWSVELNTAGLYGEFPLEGRYDVDARKVNAETRVTFDGTAPENVRFKLDALPKQLKRGDPVPLAATGDDPESLIDEVIFFAGKPLPDGKLPPNPLVAEAAQAEKGGPWVARLALPTEAKGAAEVSVRFTNGAGMSTTETIKIELVDPAPAGAKASIEGTVREGDRTQPNLTVFLRDPQGVEKDKTTTDAQGKYVFKEVPPGSYRVTASKAGGSRGETAAQVTEGQKKTGVDLKLTR